LEEHTIQYYSVHDIQQKLHTTSHFHRTKCYLLNILQPKDGNGAFHLAVCYIGEEQRLFTLNQKINAL